MIDGHKTRSAGKGVIAVLATAVAVAAVCTRLGIWQLSRLGERQAYNALLISRMQGTTVAIEALPADTAAGHYRLASASGRADYAREIAWAPRMRHGSPGVNLFTPVRRTGNDTVVLVNRGWAYSPDAKSVEFTRWREGDSVSVSGYAETFSQDCASAQGSLPVSCGDSATRVLRRLDRRAAERLVGAPIAPYIIMQTSDSALRPDSVPARVEAPILDEGPHRSYALQWFGFALVAIIGGVALAKSRVGR